MSAPVHTAERIIRFAYKDAGFLQEGDLPNSDQYADGLQRLNDIINIEQTQGLKLWLLEDLAIPLVSGQQKYVMSPTGNIVMTKPLRILQGYYLNNSQIRRPLVVLSWDEWLRLSQVNQTGEINSYFVDKQATHLDVYFWLTPDDTAATGTAHVLLQQQVEQIDNLSQDTAFPIEWGMFLRWALADDLATGQPQEIVVRAQQKAEQYRKILEDWDVEDASTQFTPDQRSQYGYSSFRG